ncbi:hypothetical protein [Magnetovibrio sp.]|uniref:hypothetical protein n=1 Tax=Magnetovibrio sp. TaxID=2024836 RepID=UPI002F93D1F4
MELRFTVWQFVRLMVHIEERTDPPKSLATLLTAWGDIWQSLDADLADLAERDFDAYSELMMDQEVVIDDATLDQAHAAQQAVEEIMAIMDRTIKSEEDPASKSERDPEHLQSLKFERRELRQLARKLGRIE